MINLQLDFSMNERVLNNRPQEYSSATQYVRFVSILDLAASRVSESR